MTRRNPRRPPARVLAARWTLVLASLAVIVTAVLAALGVVAVPGSHAAPAAHPCHVIGQALSGHGVLCQDGVTR